MILKDLCQKFSKIFTITSTLELHNKDRKYNIRSYKNKGYMLAENNRRIPMLNPDLETLNSSISQNLDAGAFISKISIQIEDCGHKYFRELTQEEIQELDKRLDDESGEINNIIVELKGEK